MEDGYTGKAGEHMRVLFIDDSQFVLEEYAAIADAYLHGHEVVASNNPSHISSLNNREFDIAFIDWQIGQRCGREVVECITCPHIYIVTGGASDYEVLSFAKERCLQIIPKPFHIDDIVACIKDVTNGT